MRVILVWFKKENEQREGGSEAMIHLIAISNDINYQSYIECEKGKRGGKTDESNCTSFVLKLLTASFIHN